MSTLRVLLAAAPSATQAVPWALFDDGARLVQSGTSSTSQWPDAAKREAVLAASAVRLVRLVLPPMPADRVQAAAVFALEDRLAGPAHAQHVVASPRQRDGRVEVSIVARDLATALARDFSRIVAEPAAAPLPPASTWRWHASAAGGGFIRRDDGSTFAVPADNSATLPAEVILAFAQAARTPPTRVEVAFPVSDDVLAAWSHASGVSFVRGPAWRWDQDAAALAAAPDLLQGNLAPTSAAPVVSRGRAWRVAGYVAAAALVLHVAASFTQWGALRFESWQLQRATLAAARDAGVVEASDAVQATSALRERFVQARHAAGRAAPGDALPLLARAAPALAALPAGALKSATFTAGTWTLDLARLDEAAAARVTRDLTAAGVAVLAAPNATGLRMRLSPASGTEMP